MGLLAQTAQASALAALSNILAQIITAYRTNSHFQLDWTPILRFVIFSILSTPPNVLWQEFLESKFPSMRPKDDPGAKKREEDTPTAMKKKELDPGNTATKFLLDQSVGAALNTWAFIAFIRGVNGASKGEVWTAVVEESYPLWLDGLKVWPIVSLISFTAIPVEKRVIFGSVIGVAWGIYLSLLTADV
ncbi:hypothetical protein EJ05DRAFT_480492 [Pseudovirgaria hyperparasitica]|uniref:Integral membrane protein, Mpv17/PMP22 family n=1 Tax=Pseudovirgaria hyperparasitica TaxID=470096 RepID=A0A6A6VV42_9PEZI|nr:uncharacterized protein EJ05DRAFT_480492 [Pseudovirgaria hyperparasitica]KAF2753490.1 hypothetical protein EJ05DRAFT_480492 [Pseudovirgaria hyperparasitica]